MGGLGNQLFQYAAGRAISIATDTTLVLSTRHGFRNDHLAKRKFELSHLDSQVGHTTPLSEFQATVRSLIRRAKMDSLMPLIRPWVGWVSDGDLTSMDFDGCLPRSRNVWMFGYWQDPRIWEPIAATIANELRPVESPRRQIIDLAAIAREPSTLAVGIRLYEEVPDVGFRERRSSSDYLNLISRSLTTAVERTNSTNLLVFSTKRHSVLNEIQWPVEPIYATAEDGVTSPHEVLWLMSQTPNHLVTGSTLYWWGAWFSWFNQAQPTEKIFALNDFPSASMDMDAWSLLT